MYVNVQSRIDTIVGEIVIWTFVKYKWYLSLVCSTAHIVYSVCWVLGDLQIYKVIVMLNYLNVIFNGYNGIVYGTN